MMKRKRETSDSELKGTNHDYSKKTALNSMAHIITAPSVLTTAEAELRIVMDDFVTVYERLDQDDDVNMKPNYSYTELIYLSILRSPNFCLPISEIYKYIKSRFSFFRNSTRKHWCNAVRHSLSKTKCFTKIAVGRGSSGNNNLNRSTYLWCIVPGSIVNFARGDYRPNVDTESGTNTLRWGYFRVNAGKFWDQVAVYLEKKMEVFQQMIFTTSSPGKVLEAQACYITGDTKLDAQKSSANPPLLREHLYNVKQRQPTHTVHYGAHDSLSDSGTKDMSITQSPNIRDNTSRDSGNDSISDTSPEDRKRKHPENITNIGRRLNTSYISVNSSVLDDTRKTPDLPDLGHVSPLSISPSLSPIGNVTYEGESLTGSLFTSIYSTIPSYASTPVISSLKQQRLPPALSYYNHSVSPPLFPSLSPPSYPISSSNNSTTGNIVHSASPPGTFYSPYVPPSSVCMSLPYLTSTVNSSMTIPSNVYMSRASQPPFYKPLQTGSFDFGTFTSGFMPQLPPYQYDPYQSQTSMASTENVYNSTPLYYHTGSDIAQTPTADWSTM